MAGIYGVTLADLTNFMRTYPTGRIVPDQYVFSDTYDALKGAINSEEFQGLFMETLIQTSREFTGRAHGSQVGLPFAGTSAFIKCFTPLRRLVVTAGVDKESMDRASGPPGSWGNIPSRQLDQMFDDFKILNEYCALGYADGALARSNGVGVQCTAAGVTDDATGTCVKITCDNTYRDFALWENVQMMRVGMRVAAYNAAGSNLTAVTETVANGASIAHVGCAVVTAVAPGPRLASADWAATTGYVVVRCCSVAQAHALANALDDGSVIYLYSDNSATHATSNLYLPMGLSGLVQNDAVGTYVDGLDAGRNVEPWVPSAEYGIATFNRADYTQLNSMILDAVDFGVSSDNPAAGTPTYWALSVLRNAINDRENATGVKIDKVICSLEIAECIDRMNATENHVTVQVNTASGTSMRATAGRAAKTFEKSDGSTCDIVVSRNMAKHCIVGIGTEPFQWAVKDGGFDFFRLYGTEWQPVMGQRVDSFEAPYGGYSQLSADRVDHCFILNDLRYDIA